MLKFFKKWWMEITLAIWFIISIVIAFNLIIFNFNNFSYFFHRFCIYTAKIIPIFIGAYLAFRFNSKNEEEKSDREIKAIIKAIFTEISVLKNIYHEEFDQDIFRVADNSYSLYSIRITQDFFPVYHNNVQFIGKIKNNEIRSSIIEIYTEIKRFIEYLIIYRDDLENLNKNRSRFFQETEQKIISLIYLSTINNIFFDSNKFREEENQRYLNWETNYKNNLIQQTKMLKDYYVKVLDKIDNFLKQKDVVNVINSK